MSPGNNSSAFLFFKSEFWGHVQKNFVQNVFSFFYSIKSAGQEGSSGGFWSWKCSWKNSKLSKNLIFWGLECSICTQRNTTRFEVKAEPYDVQTIQKPVRSHLNQVLCLMCANTVFQTSKNEIIESMIKNFAVVCA